MTKAKLKMNVALVIIALLALLALALLFEEFHRVLKDFSGIFLAIAASYLAYCFQRRQAFLSSLKDLWHKCIEAKADLVDYTHNINPDQESYGKAHRSISIAIDMVCAVYCNVSESQNSLGFFPFEPLHDMRRSLENIGFQDVSEEQCLQARANIIQSWNTFRWVFLKELSTPKPTHYILGRNERDPRRK